MRTMVRIGFLVFVIVADCFASADPEMNVEGYPIHGPTVFNVGGREITIIEMWGRGVSVYTDVESTYPVLYDGTLAEDVVFVHGDVTFLVPAESVVAFHRSGSLQWTSALGEDTAFPVNERMVKVTAEHDIYTPLCFYEDGTLEKAILAEETVLTVAGLNIRCRGYVGFGKTGQVNFCTSAEEIVVPHGNREVEIAAKSSLGFHADGSLRRFTPKNQIIVKVQDLRMPLRVGSEVLLYEDGSIQSGTFVDAPVLRVGRTEVTLNAGSQSSFHRNGELQSGHLIKQTDLDTPGGRLPCIGIVEFDTEGQVVSCTPVVGQSIRIGEWEVVLATSSLLRYHPDGGLALFTPKNSISLATGNLSVALKAGHPVSFHENGVLRSCGLAESLTMSMDEGSVRIAPGDGISFHMDGSLDRGVLEESAVLKVGRRSFPVAAGYPLEFHPDGSLEFAMTSEETVVEYQGGETSVDPGYYVHFNRSGEAVFIEPVY